MRAQVMLLLMHYSYLAVFLLIMLEDFGLPAPGETALIVASVAAAAGKLNIWGVLGAAFLGALIGDNIGWAIGHWGGRKLVIRVGSKVGVTDERYRRAEGFFSRFGDVIVVGARFVEGLRQLNGIIAGTMGMHWATFIAYNALGAALWVGVWGSVGYFAGEHIRQIERWLLRFSWLGLLIALAAAIWWISTHRTEPAPTDGV